ncbi:MAG: hypothetical protein BGO78_15685 [Chloroflexi bacterium 44-23]|nr:MAG: hypothetical protein BGO78_15685 [Chloroflexi bacterium 44-23]
MALCSEIEWREILSRLPHPHFLQTSAWSEIKANNGWQAFFLIWKNNSKEIVAGAMILERQIRPFPLLRLPIQYVPKGPLLDWKNSELVAVVLKDIADFAQQRKAIFIKIDPEIYLENPIYFLKFEDMKEISGQVEASMSKNGWQFSDSQIQFQNTLWIDLEPDEDEILTRMKQKTRYNIRLAAKKDIRIRLAKPEDYEKVYRLYAATSIRDGFVIRSQSYYFDVWKNFTDANICYILLAEFEGEVIAALVMYIYGCMAYYIYGMSSDKNRNLMPTYLLQWEAIKLAKKSGARFYDLWGAPINLEESDPMYGVYRFKVGLGGIFVRTIGAWDLVLRKSPFFLYQRIIPKILAIMRSRGRKETLRSLD